MHELGWIEFPFSFQVSLKIQGQGGSGGPTTEQENQMHRPHLPFSSLSNAFHYVRAGTACCEPRTKNPAVDFNVYGP